MVSCKSLLLWSVTALLLPPATCQASPLAIDIGRELVVYEGYIYRSKWPFVNVNIGSPAQSLKMLLSIQVGDIVVLASNGSDPRCGGTEYADFLCQWGLYDTTASSTYTASGRNTTDGYDTYGNSTTGSDVVQVAGKTFDNMPLVFRNQDWPIFGVGGYTTQEHVASAYSNIPIQLNRDRDTNINGFSLYFQRVNATTPGRLIFGGVETSKFTGTLQTLETPFSPDTLSYGNITAQLANMSISTSSATNAINNFANTQVVLSAQVAGLILPESIRQQVLVQLNVSEAQVLTAADYPDSDLLGPLLPYDSAPNDTSINLQFGGVEIRIPVWDMMVPFNSTHGFLEVAQADTDDLPYIGTSFFSNAYSVFDFTHNQISIAPLRHEALDEDDIMAINSTGVAGLEGYVAGSSPSPSSPTNPPSSGGLSTGAKAGIGVGVALGGLLVIGLIVFFVWRSRRRRLQQNVHDPNINNTAYTAPGPAPGHAPGHAPGPGPNYTDNSISGAASNRHSEMTELAGTSENVRHTSYGSPGHLSPGYGNHSYGTPGSPMSDTNTFSTMNKDNIESMSNTTHESERADAIKRKPVQVSELP